MFVGSRGLPSTAREQVAAPGADVADAKDQVPRQFALHFKTKLVVDRRAEVVGDDGAGEVRRIEPRRLRSGMAAKAPDGRQVNGRDERERAGDVQVDVDEAAVVCAGVAAAEYEFVAARQPTQNPVASSAWVPVESNAWLEVVCVGTGNGREPEALIISR